MRESGQAGAGSFQKNSGFTGRFLREERGGAAKVEGFIQITTKVDKVRDNKKGKKLIYYVVNFPKIYFLITSVLAIIS